MKRKINNNLGKIVVHDTGQTNKKRSMDWI